MSQLSNNEVNRIMSGGPLTPEQEKNLANSQMIGNGIGGLVAVALIVYAWKTGQKWWFYLLSLTLVPVTVAMALARLIYASKNK